MVVVVKCPKMESFSCGLVEVPDQLKIVRVPVPVPVPVRVPVEADEGYFPEDLLHRDDRLWEKHCVNYLEDLLHQNRKLEQGQWFWMIDFNTTIQKLYSFANPKHPERSHFTRSITICSARRFHQVINQTFRYAREWEWEWEWELEWIA
ncbi:hypothetical protein O6P43_002267 [Quillaja saponaria]|uniref:Uncharacterized protein n=1 Tax=Quillaja saponaria TaxID=32244 RepID=A0AAD7VKC1_QUISA|nr:hypothetical protein O6P43_002267 [Quillaja saponaria]